MTQFRQRFIRESRAAAAVDDPHIIPVFEAGEAEGLLFIAMRYVPGGDVGSLIARRRADRRPSGPSRRSSRRWRSALDAAHAAGLVHRDVKPLEHAASMSGQGRPDHVYLTDFGHHHPARRPKAALVTAAGPVRRARLSYVAPEQINGLNVDGRADQYSLACSAFEMLAGSLPFQAEGLAVLAAHLNERPPPLTSRRPGSPAGRR